MSQSRTLTEPSRPIPTVAQADVVVCGGGPGASRCFGCDIPYRCLLSVGVPNVLSSGRCISATHEGMAGARVMGTCVALGQAAGTAAALAARHGADPAAVDVLGLRDALRREGQLV